MIDRALFVLTSPSDGQQFLRVVPDLTAIGLSEAMLLHVLSVRRGPAEPMPELAVWVRHFETLIPKVELGLKRGDPVKWIYELCRVRGAKLVVLSGVPNGEGWDFERSTSPLRSLGIPILYLPADPVRASLTQKVVVAVKSPDQWQNGRSKFTEWLQPSSMEAIHVAEPAAESVASEGASAEMTIVPQEECVAHTLLDQAAQRQATLLTIFAGEEAQVDPRPRGTPVVKPLMEAIRIPVLIWSAEER